MHNAKTESYTPFNTPTGPDGVEMIADVDGCQVNVMIDGTCAYRLNIDKFLQLKLVEHTNGKSLFEVNLEKEYFAEDVSKLEKEANLFSQDPADFCPHLPCGACEESKCEYM